MDIYCKDFKEVRKVVKELDKRRYKVFIYYDINKVITNAPIKVIEEIQEGRRFFNTQEGGEK